jgi:hypothetical protein
MIMILALNYRPDRKDCEAKAVILELLLEIRILIALFIEWWTIGRTNVPILRKL